MKPIIIGNWKMNLTPSESGKLASQITKSLTKEVEKDVVVCPSFVSLGVVSGKLKGSSVALGSQDVFWQAEGAYTGEIAAQSLIELGCQYSIVGHSERRQILGETDAMVNKKVDVCLDNNLIPIVCIGETRREKQLGQTDGILVSQLLKALAGIDLVKNEQIVIAYEPVWAIGSDKVVDVGELSYVLDLIRQTLFDIWPASIVNNNTRLIYGGSVDLKNSENFANLDGLDGFLIGGDSLNAEEFTKIVENF
jgi:triosephosphate isomerase (TIM)